MKQDHINNPPMSLIIFLPLKQMILKEHIISAKIKIIKQNHTSNLPILSI